jgi:hypothetical protein
MSTSKFLANFFAASTGSIYACSLANERDAGTPAEVCGRGDWGRLNDLVSQWDRPGRGTFFCVNTIMPRQTRRAKETVAEIVALHADVDFDKISATPQEAETKLSQLLLLPSYLVASGNGLHAYWLLREAAAVTPRVIAQAEHLLRLLASHIGGDRAVCEIARLMRLPGSHNSKRNEWHEVRIIAERGCRYDLGELADWLNDVRPLILPRQAAANGNPFLAAELPHGGGAPVDIEARLAAMRYRGTGDTSVHATQLTVTAAMLNRGCSLEETVAQVLAATRRAVGPGGVQWNWQREEHDLRGMCATWARKKLNGSQPSRPRGTSLEDLGTMTFPPVAFLVPDLIPAEGVTLICSKPKVGKSWLLYDLSISATVDRDMLGGRRPLQGYVLYLALEDSLRLRSRAEKLLPAWAGPWPPQAELHTEWRRVDQGGLDHIRDWVQDVRAGGAAVACVCIDVLKMVRPAGQDRKAAYDRDYEALTGLRSLAHELAIPIVIAHHVRKLEADDLIDKVSGTFGLSGSADTVFVIERTSNDNFVFDVRGRDVEAVQLAARFDREVCRWEVLGSAAEVQRSDAQRAILAALATGDTLTRQEIAAATGLGLNTIGPTLYRMVKDGAVTKSARGRYAATTSEAASPHAL